MIYRRACYLTLASVLVAVFCANAEAGLFKKKPVAHVFVGDIQPTSEMKRKGQAAINAALKTIGDMDGGHMLQEATGIKLDEVSHPDPYVGLKPLMKKKIKELEAKGYKVKVHDATHTSEIKKHLTDKRTKAVVWFGHGDSGIPGSVHTMGEDDTLTPDEIRSWAQEKVAKKWGWKQEKSTDKPDLAELIKNAQPDQRKEIREQWYGASLDLDYGYFHTCHSFDNEHLASVLMKKDMKSEFIGYEGVKWGWDEQGSKEAISLDGKIYIVPSNEAQMLRDDPDDYFKRQSLLGHGEEGTVADFEPLSLEEFEAPVDTSNLGKEMEHLEMPVEDLFDKVGQGVDADFKTMQIMNEVKQQENIGKQADQQSKLLTDKAGMEAKAIGQASAAKVQKADMDASWSKVWGEVIETSIGAGMSAAGGAAGAAVGDQMADTLFPEETKQATTPSSSTSAAGQAPTPPGPGATQTAGTTQGGGTAGGATTASTTKPATGNQQGGSAQGGQQGASTQTAAQPPTKPTGSTTTAISKPSTASTVQKPSQNTPPAPGTITHIPNKPLKEFDCESCGAGGHVRTTLTVVPCMMCGEPVTTRPYSGL